MELILNLTNKVISFLVILTLQNKNKERNSSSKITRADVHGGVTGVGALDTRLAEDNRGGLRRDRDLPVLYFEYYHDGKIFEEQVEAQDEGREEGEIRTEGERQAGEDAGFLR